MTASADSPVPIPSVGHVCVGPSSSRKPGLCWICGQFLPHDCVGNAQPPPCWHPAWEDRQPVEASQGSVTVSPAAFGPNVLIGTVRDRVRFLVERADVGDLVACLLRAYDQGVRLPHGPPQKVEMDFAAAELRVLTEAAKRLTVAGRKWPIGTPDEHAWKLASDGCRDDHGPSYEWHLRLAAARTHRNLTLDALGARLNPPRTRKDISAMEHGRRGLSVELCAQLADALDCDRLWLAGWTL